MTVFTDVTAATISGAFAFGMVLTLLGSLKLALTRRFDPGQQEGSELLIAWLVFAFNLALIPMVLLSGVLLDTIKAPPLMILGSVLTSLALFSLAWTARGKTDFHRAMLASLVLGLGGACLMTSSIFLMPQAFFRGDLTVNNLTPASINVGMVFIALGAVIMPVLADLLLRLTRFRLTLTILGVLALAPMAFVLLTSEAAFREDHLKFTLHTTSNSLSALVSSALWSNWRLWLLGAICFVYLPVEFSLNTWATTFLRDHRYSEGLATYLLSGFWLTFVLSRLIVGALAYNEVLPRGSGLGLLVGLGVLAAICLGNLASSGRPLRALIGLLLLGLFLGPVFPTLVAVVFEDLPGVPKGTAFGVMYAIGAMGNLLLTPLIGLWAGIRNIRAALYLPLILMVLLATMALTLAVTSMSEMPELPPEVPEAATAPN